VSFDFDLFCEYLVSYLLPSLASVRSLNQNDFDELTNPNMHSKMMTPRAK
jgi:hypothetical protein